jgi:hypothetical protein
MSDEIFFELSPGERNSALWMKLLEHFKTKLAIARGKNDGPQDEIVTSALRGQIAVYKMLIALDNDPYKDSQ